MAEELRVGVVADASGLGPGLASATSQVQTSAQAMAEAQKVATIATQNLAQAQVQLGAAAAQGNAAAAAVIAEYAAASTQAAAAVQQLTQASTAEAPALQSVAAAANNAAGATTRLGGSTRTASAVIGGLEGHMMSGNRAAAAFLTTTLGLGPALQAAFPVIGALAMAEVLVDIGKSAYNAYEKFVSIDAVWDKLDQDARKLQGQDFVNVHSIETATERLKEANEAAGALRATAEEIHKVGMADLARQILGGDFVGLAGSASQLLGAHGAAEGSAEQTRNSLALQAKTLADQHEMTDLKIEAAHSADSALVGEARLTAEYSKRVALAREEQSYNNARDRALGNATPANAGSEKLGLEEQAAGGELEAGRIELLRRAHAEYVSEFVADERRKAEELKASQITWATVMEEFDRGQKEETEAMRKSEEADRRATDEFKRNREEQQVDGREAAQVVIESANEQFAASERHIRQQEELGQVSHRVATQQIIDAERLKETTTEGALSKEAGLFDPLEGGREQRQFDQIETQMTLTAEKASAERQKITDQETQRFVKQWREVTVEFNRDFTQAFNSVVTGQESVGQAFGKMFGNLELQTADFIVKWLLQQEEAHLLAKLSDAKVAAANAYAWGSAFGGPIGGAAAAAVAFTAVEAFEYGGIVGGSAGAPVPIIAHAGERVLSAGQTSNFESMVNSGGNRSASLHQENHFGGGVTEDMLAAHTADTMSKLRSMIRPEAFA